MSAMNALLVGILLIPFAVAIWERIAQRRSEADDWRSHIRRNYRRPRR